MMKFSSLHAIASNLGWLSSLCLLLAACSDGEMIIPDKPESFRTQDESKGSGNGSTSITLPLKTQGNKILKSDGTPFVGHGVNILDTRGCNTCAFFAPNPEEVKRRVDHAINDWGVTFFRLLVESYESSTSGTNEGTRVQYGSVLEDPVHLQHIVDIVEHIGRYPNVYVLVSLWKDPSLDPKTGWPTAKTSETWQVLAKALLAQPHVLFGVSNEPAGYQFDYPGINVGAEVHKRMSAVVRTIRQIEREEKSPFQHLIAVQGPEGWSRLINYYVTNPITVDEGRNIIYESHAYTDKTQFDEDLFTPAKTLPVIIGEFGPYTEANMGFDDIEEMVQKAEKVNMPMLGWIFAPNCNTHGESTMLERDSQGKACTPNMPLNPTKVWGTYFRQQLRRLANMPE